MLRLTMLKLKRANSNKAKRMTERRPLCVSLPPRAATTIMILRLLEPILMESLAMPALSEKKRRVASMRKE